MKRPMTLIHICMCAHNAGKTTLLVPKWHGRGTTNGMHITDNIYPSLLQKGSFCSWVTTADYRRPPRSQLCDANIHTVLGNNYTT